MCGHHNTLCVLVIKRWYFNPCYCFSSWSKSVYNYKDQMDILFPDHISHDTLTSFVAVKGGRMLLIPLVLNIWHFDWLDCSKAPMDNTLRN